ncbi:MAG: hypothetical protein EOP47_29810, partial [Sphingobacteriaceae bacterium]
TGPFTEVAEPKLAINSEMPAAGLNNGDHDIFIDDDGTAYLAFTDWRTKGTIVIEKLSADYLTGTGEHVKAVTDGQTEAPGMFKRKGVYYVVYSDPNCGYCSGTGSSYRTALAPLGPWSAGKKISENSCGGQPSFISTIKINAKTVYLYGSDLWNNAAKNEALANYYWAPLTFAEDGSINPLNCPESYQFPKAVKPNVHPTPDNTSGNDDFSAKCDISQQLQRAQSFTAKKTGELKRVTVTVFKNNNPDQTLVISIYAADGNLVPAGKALYTKPIDKYSIGWSAKNVVIKPNIMVDKGKQYAIVLKSASATGCYGIQSNNLATFRGAAGSISTDGGITFKIDDKYNLRFQTFIKGK